MTNSLSSRHSRERNYPVDKLSEEAPVLGNGVYFPGEESIKKDAC